MKAGSPNKQQRAADCPDPAQLPLDVVSKPLAGLLMRRFLRVSALCALLALVQADCNRKPANDDGPAQPLVKCLHGVDLAGAGPLLDESATRLAAARNETVSLVVQLAGYPKPTDKTALTLKFAPLQHQEQNAQIPVESIRAYQVLSMPVDVNRAGYVRHTGQNASSRTLPRALLAAPMDAGKINVLALRDPADPLKPTSRVGLSDQPILMWFDIQVPATTLPGAYATTVELVQDGQRIAVLPIALKVYDFVLPDERHLHMVGRVEWASLEALYPDLFENITPHLMSRKDPRYADAIRLLDQLVKLAQEHRTTMVVPRLAPVVKWPANAPPQVDWTDFDTIVEPWLKGDAFADRVPVGYWPLPRTEFLDRYPVPLQLQYWMAATSHFDAKGWLERSWVEVEKETPGRANPQECVKLSTRTAEILAAHPRLRVSLPLEDQQLQFASQANPALINPADAERVMAAAAGIVYAPNPPDWVRPAKLSRWLRTDLPGLVPYIGAGGDERDVRLWAWLAFLRQSQVIGWDGALPHSKSPSEPADPNDLTWFYPGRWFGLEEPLPTVQLKWLRRAQQDYEYLYLARQRGQVIYSLVMSRLMIKPVQTQPNEEPDPTHGLLSGTTEPRAWTKAIELLARNILLREPGKELDTAGEAALNIETANWIAPQDKPLQIGRSTAWGWSAQGGNWLDLRLGMDIYNASDQPLQGELQWVSAPRGWEFNPQPIEIGPTQAINVFQVKQFGLDGRVDLSRLGPETRRPVQIKFTDSMRKRPSYLTVMVPAAASDKREGKLMIDGALGDWDETADAIQNGPMVLMLDRPNLQKQAMQMAATPSLLFSNWSAKNVYVAFKLEGLLTGESKTEKNFVDYQLRRGWGEDLCEILVQPVYTKPGDVGQIVHLVCKPRGQMVVSTKHSPKNQKRLGTAFKEVAQTEVRFASSTEGGAWRGEVSIPWELLNDADHKDMRPRLLRFNFVQYKAANGESSSWAGPVDYARDDSMMGVLYLRDHRAPGMRE